jgi:18S rRNA (adenine1779-N6/adenine1780-N6)-dimethyltransferase
MGKVKTPKRAGASSSSPYDRNSSTAKPSSAPKNNVFKFNKDFGQHILKNPGVADGQFDVKYCLAEC